MRDRARAGGIGGKAARQPADGESGGGDEDREMAHMEDSW